MPTVRLLPFATADGPHNMAADETLLQSAAAGVASLRFYGWSDPTLSLGYFQPERVRRSDPLLAELPFVRRPSGGDTLVHHHELTYALAVPPGPPWQTGESWLTRMHTILATALADLGVDARPFNPPAGQQQFAGPLCFRHHTAGDLLIGPHKIVGSAQRRQRGALLQHGAILLAQSPSTPSLPGIRELTSHTLAVDNVRAAVERTFFAATGWDRVSGEWADREQQYLQELIANRYTQDGWNRKR